MRCGACEFEFDDAEPQCPACGEASGTEKTLARASDSAEIIDGKWAVEKKLGAGGMGSVFLCRDLELGRRVAIKMMSAAFIDNAELVNRFEREARMMARLDHPNLVPVYAVGRREKTPFIVMKYLEGRTLGEVLDEKHRLSGAELLSVVKQLCEGLQFVHDQKVVHRDLKPANVFVSPTGHVTLLDLGVAHDTENRLTRTGMLVGTPRYMAPEQILGKPVSAASDLYSLAALTFELMTGRTVFDAETDYELMRAHVDTPAPDAATIVALPPAVNDVLQRGLAKRPEERFGSVREFYAALETAWNSGPPVLKSGPSTLPPAHVPSRATPAPMDDAALLLAPRSRAPAIIVGLLGVTAVVLAVWLGVAWMNRETPPSPPVVTQQAPVPVAKVEPVVERVAPEPTPTPTPEPTPVAAVEPAPVQKPEPVVTPRKPVATTAQVTFVAKVNGGPAPAFVDLDGERQKQTPFVKTLKAGKHTVVFFREGAPSVKREIEVVAGKDQKVLVEMAK